MIEIKIDGETIEIFATGTKGKLTAECSSVIHSAAEILYKVEGEKKSKEHYLDSLCGAAMFTLPFHEALKNVACDVEITDCIEYQVIENDKD